MKLLSFVLLRLDLPVMSEAGTITISFRNNTDTVTVYVSETSVIMIESEKKYLFCYVALL